MISDMVFILALADGLVFGMWAINAVISIVLAIGMYMINNRTRKMETVEQRLNATAEKLVEGQIAIKTGVLASSIEKLTSEVTRILQRLDSGDGRMEKLGERDQRTELALNNQTRELQTWMMEKFATKGDVEHVSTKLDSLADRVGTMAIANAGQGYSPTRTSKGA